MELPQPVTKHDAYMVEIIRLLTSIEKKSKKAPAKRAAKKPAKKG